MPTKESVVTPQRYAQGLTWDEYLAFIASPANLDRGMPNGGPRTDNSARFRRNIDDFTPTPDEIAALKALPQRKMLAIGEDWCPDVYRGLPVLAKICGAAGWELRLFPRDLHRDIMAEFLNRGEFESIPVAVLYTPDHRYLGHWIERPAIANAYYERLQKTFTQREGESEEEMRARIARSYKDLQTSDDWDRWRHETVREISEIAKKAPA